MKTVVKVSWVLVGALWVGCSSSVREFSDADGGRAGSENSGGAGSNDGGKSQGGSQAGKSTGAADSGGSGASDEGGAPGGGSETTGGSSGSSGSGGVPGAAGEATGGSGPEACTEEQTFCAGTATCTDVAKDAKNCGVCGHDCGALSACENSRCAPAPLITGLTLADSFDVSSKGLFYTTNNTIQHCTNPVKCASTVQQVGTPSAASSMAITKTLATDVVAFYGRNAASEKYPGYHTCPASGCGTVSLANQGPSGAVSGIIGDGGELFYQTSGNTSDASTSSLVRLTGKADGTQGAKLTIGNRAFAGFRIAVDASYVYYVRLDTNDLANVVACSRSEGCGNNYVSLGTGAPTNFAAYGGKLYWQNGIQLKRCDAADPASAAAVTSLPSAYDKDMLIDAKNIYWLTANSVVYCTLPSCTGGVKTLASGLASPKVMRQDDKFVYWLVQDVSGPSTGAIYRIAKP